MRQVGVCATPPTSWGKRGVGGEGGGLACHGGAEEDEEALEVLDEDEDDALDHAQLAQEGGAVRGVPHDGPPPLRRGGYHA